MGWQRSQLTGGCSTAGEGEGAERGGEGGGEDGGGIGGGGGGGGGEGGIARGQGRKGGYAGASAASPNAADRQPFHTIQVGLGSIAEHCTDSFVSWNQKVEDFCSNHSTPFKLFFRVLQSITQIVFFILKKNSGGLLFQPVKTVPVNQNFIGKQISVPFVVADKYEANKWNTSSQCRPCSLDSYRIYSLPIKLKDAFSCSWLSTMLVCKLSMCHTSSPANSWPLLVNLPIFKTVLSWVMRSRRCWRDPIPPFLLIFGTFC